MIPTCIYVSTYESYVQDRVATLLRFIGSVSNLSLLTIGGYYYYNSHDKIIEKENGDRAGIWYGYWWV
jgi:hypothetical protein